MASWRRRPVRVDAHDNIWVVDRYSSMVMKFHPDGTVAMLLGRKPESVDVPSSRCTGRGNSRARAPQSDLFDNPRRRGLGRGTATSSSPTVW